MDSRVTRLIIRTCLVLGVVAVPASAQQVAVEQGLTASTQSVYTPPACVPGVPFSDITCTTGFDPWIEQFGLDGITAGCGGGKYCPGTPVTRDQMAVFIEKAMRGTANWPPHTVLVFHHPGAEPNSNINSGTELLSMVAAIPSTGSEAPSATTPWLIRVGPGIYDLGSSSLTLLDYVGIEGAGRAATVIMSSGSAVTSATIVGPAYAEVSNLSIINSGGNAFAWALDLGEAATVRGVSISVTAGSSLSLGIRTEGSIATIKDVDLTLSNPGSGEICGIVVAGAAVTIEGAKLRLSNDGSGAVYGINSPNTTTLNLSLVTIAITTTGSGGGAGIFIVGNVLGRNVVLTSAFGGGTTATVSGVVASGQVSLTDSDIAAGCAGNAGPAYGVIGGQFVTLADSRSYSWRYGGATCTCTGVYFQNANGSIRNSQAYGYNNGVVASNATAAKTVTIDGSVVRSINNGASYTMHVGATRLSYNSTNAGTLTCAGVYTDTGVFYPNTCP